MACCFCGLTPSGGRKNHQEMNTCLKAIRDYNRLVVVPFIQQFQQQQQNPVVASVLVAPKQAAITTLTKVKKGREAREVLLSSVSKGVWIKPANAKVSVLGAGFSMTTSRVTGVFKQLVDRKLAISRNLTGKANKPLYEFKII